jgi:hypothetical protein
MTVKIYKMINGDDIIGDELKAENTNYQIKSPAQIVLQQTEKGMGVAIAPYMPYASGNISLYYTAIAAECVPDQNMINEYNRIFGSGIQVAPANALAGLQIAK